MAKETILNQVTLCADGSIGLQWMKRVLDPDTGVLLFEEPHRSVIDFNGDLESQLDAVSAHLEQMGYPAIDEPMRQRVRAIDAVAKADAIIEANRQAKTEAVAQLGLG